MAGKIFTIKGCPLALETVQGYINYEIYDYVSESSVVATSYTCHICATSMPVNSVSTHLTSDIHRMWLSVAEQAVERLRRQALATMPLALTPPPDTVFCQTCGVHVQDNHSCPKQYTTREVALRRFLKIYQNTVSEDGIDDNVASNDVLANSNENKQSDIEIETDTLTEDIEIPSVSSNEVLTNAGNEDIENPSVSSNEVPYADDDDHINTSHFENRFILNQIKKRKLSEVEIQMLKYYGYIFKDQDYSHNILVHNAEYVDIVTPIGDCVRVTEDNYHGFYTVNGKTLCRVCRYLVQDKNVHMRTEDHMDRIRCLLTDKNCIRQLNLLWNHCVLCNEIIENVEFHVTCSETHKAALCNALIAPGCLRFDGSQGTELIECLICAKTLEKEDLQCHAASAEHKKLLREKRLQLGDEDPIFSHHHLHTSQGRIRCKVCYIELDEDADKIADHVDSKNHKNVYQAILQQDRIEQVQSKLQCKVCSVELTDDTVLQHIASEDHGTNIRELHCCIARDTPELCKKPAVKEKQLNCHYSRTEDPDKVWCKVCLVFLKNDRYTMNAHRKLEPYHNKKYNNKLKLNKMQKKVGKKYVCEACNVVVKRAKVVDHWLSVTHKSQLKQINLSRSRTLPNPSTAQGSIANMPSADVHDSGLHSAVNSVPSSFTNSYETDPIVSQMIANNLLVPTEKWIKCNICNYKFANTDCNFKTHLHGVQHSFNLDSLLKKNKIMGHSPRYKCTYCGMKLGPNNVIDHINNNNHKVSKAAIAYEDSQTEGCIEIRENSNEVYCNACNIRIPNYPTNIQEHVRGRRHVTRVTDGDNAEIDNSIISEEKVDILSGVLELQAELESGTIIKSTKDGQNWYCNACGCVILNDPKVHVRDPKHNIAYDAIMAAHNILRNFL